MCLCMKPFSVVIYVLNTKVVYCLKNTSKLSFNLFYAAFLYDNAAFLLKIMLYFSIFFHVFSWGCVLKIIFKFLA